jgi:hypothetical protein
MDRSFILQLLEGERLIKGKCHHDMLNIVLA